MVFPEKPKGLAWCGKILPAQIITRRTGDEAVAQWEVPCLWAFCAFVPFPGIVGTKAFIT